ncbi:MAG: hypothetical protein ACYTF6_00150 [Planctomycetota bacterium]|jgi:acyl-CoA synthetase (NDP forming)
MSLEGFFNPGSVAVVGASREKGKAGHEILAALIRGGYEGKILPDNKAMLNIFENCGLTRKTEFDGEAYSFSFELAGKSH